MWSRTPAMVAVQETRQPNSASFVAPLEVVYAGNSTKSTGKSSGTEVPKETTSFGAPLDCGQGNLFLDCRWPFQLHWPLQDLRDTNATP